jgi:hydrogenase maturation protease
VTRRRIVIGIGNRWRTDDGIGPAVAEAVAGRRLPGVDVIVLDGEPGRLLDAWDGADVAVVVDAMRVGYAPGHVEILDAGLPFGAQGSSHGLGLAEALALGRRLDRLPGRIAVLAVEGADFSYGDQLSPAVGVAVEPATELVCDLVAGPPPDGDG